MLKLSMKHITTFTLFWACVLLGWNCRKDVVEIRPYPVSKQELATFFKQVPDPTSTITFNFNGLNQDKMLETPNGMRISLTDVDQLFSTLNNPTPFACSTCPDLKVEITIATSRGDMLARALPTTTIDNQLLESGGMVSVKVFCGNTELKLLQGRTLKIQFPAPNAKDNMFVFAAESNADGFLGWVNTGQEVFKADWLATGISGSVKGYELVVSKLGWIHCARTLTHADVSPFCCNLQPGFTGLNTQAYLVFENVHTVVPLQFDDSTHTFCFPSIPAGFPVRAVSVAKLGPQYWLGDKITETGTNSSLPLELEKQDVDQVLGYLRGL
jgi:hypothetical protein